MPTLIGQGLELLVYGMGTVVVFLTVLVFATRLMSWFVQTYLPEAEAATPESALPATAAASHQPTRAQLAAITAALHQHRSRS